MAATAATPSRHHRRSSSNTPSYFTTDHLGPGAFAPMPILPRRKSAPAPAPAPPSPPRPRPRFEFHNDESTTDDDDDENSSGNNTTTPHGHNDNTRIPFPVTTTFSSSPPSPPPPPTRSPVLLANGKPLRPSLKSSSSSPHIPTLHTRAHSAPTSPLNQPDAPPLSPPPPTPHKNVHFQDDTRLASVRVFHKAGRPRSVSEDRPWDDTETETEGYESNSNSNLYSNNSSSSSGNTVPFPVLASPSTITVKMAESPMSTPIPAPPLPPLLSSSSSNRRGPPHVLLTSLNLHSSSGHGSSLSLHGSLIVLNIAYEKHVSVRFTLDGWATTCEVQASWAGAGVLPGNWARLAGMSSLAPSYDTFTFQVALSDLCLTRLLTQRTLVLCARYAALDKEWWDNNEGRNYEVRFVEMTTPLSEKKKPIRPALPGRSYSAPVPNSWDEESSASGGFASLPTVKAMRAMNGADARKRVESGVKWGSGSGSIPPWTAPSAWPIASSSGGPTTTTTTATPSPPVRLPLNLDNVDALSRGTGFSHFTLPDLPATEVQQQQKQQETVQPHSHHRQHHQERHVNSQLFPVSTTTTVATTASASASSVQGSSGAQTPPESPYLNTKLTLKNYAAPGRGRSASVGASVESERATTPTSPPERPPAPPAPLPSPPLKHQNHSPLPTPPASRSSSFTDAYNLNNHQPVKGGVGGTSPVPSPLPTPARASTTSTSYEALLARWCFHTSGPMATGAGAETGDRGRGSVVEGSSSELVKPTMPARVGPGASASSSILPSPSLPTRFSSTTVLASAMRTPRTGSLDDVPGYGGSSTVETEAEYGSDPGPETGAGTGSTSGKSWGHWTERRVWT